MELEPAFAQVLATQLDPMFVMREEEHLYASDQGGVLRHYRLRARTEVPHQRSCSRAILL